MNDWYARNKQLRNFAKKLALWLSKREDGATSIDIGMRFSLSPIVLSARLNALIKTKCLEVKPNGAYFWLGGIDDADICLRLQTVQ